MTQSRFNEASEIVSLSSVFCQLTEEERFAAVNHLAAALSEAESAIAGIDLEYLQAEPEELNFN